MPTPMESSEYLVPRFFTTQGSTHSFSRSNGTLTTVIYRLLAWQEIRFVASKNGRKKICMFLPCSTRRMCRHRICMRLSSGLFFVFSVRTLQCTACFDRWIVCWCGIVLILVFVIHLELRKGDASVEKFQGELYLHQRHV